jgi:hypothetical protein
MDAATLRSTLFLANPGRHRPADWTLWSFNIAMGIGHAVQGAAIQVLANGRCATNGVAALSLDGRARQTWLCEQASPDAGSCRDN